MKHILRIVKHLIILFLIVLPLQLIGMAVLAIVLPFIKKDTHNLPKYLKWFDNYEFYYQEDLEDGLDGLAGPINYRKQRNIYPYGKYNYFKLLYERYIWLAIRNPVNYFKYSKLGIVWDRTARVTESNMKYNVGDQSDRGFFYQQVRLDGKNYYEYYWVYKYPFIQKCIRIRIGHKFGDPKYINNYSTVSWVCAISPFKTYSGK